MNINSKTRQIPCIMLADERHQAQSPKPETSFIHKQRTLQEIRMIKKKKGLFKETRNKRISIDSLTYTVHEIKVA
jgi:hypothetical protein